MTLQDTNFRKLWERASLPALFLAIAAFHLWGLMRFPAPFVDDAWVGARAWDFLSTGRVFGALDQGVIDQFEGHWTFFPWLSTVFFSWGMRWFAEPSLLGIRLVSFTSGLFLLAAIYQIAKSIGGSRLAKLSFVIVSLSLPFQYSSHLGRYDIFTATFGFWGIALYLINKSRSSWMSLLSGLLIGLSFETHAHGAIYVPVILALFFFDFRWIVFRQRHFWSMLLGLSMGFLVYFSVHVLPYSESFLAFNQIIYGPTHVPPLFTFNPTIMLDGLLDLLGLLWGTHWPVLLFIPFVLWDLAKSNDRKHRRFLLIALSLTLAHALLVRTKHLYYAILLSPAIDISLAIFILRLFEKSLKQRRVFSYARAFALIVLSLFFILKLAVPLSDRSQNYDHVQRQMSQFILPEDRLMGGQAYWFSFYENTYLSWENIVYYQRNVAGSDMEDAFREFRPDILILDQHWSVYVTDDAADDIYFDNLQLSKTEFDEFLTKVNAVLLTTIEDPEYGPLLLYRLSWGE